MKNFVQTGDNVTLPAPAGGVTSGELVIVGNLPGVAFTSAEAGADVVLATRGVFELPKRSTATFTSGGAVSYDISAKRCDAPGSGLYPIGAATEAAGTGTTAVKVRLDGVSTSAAS